MNRHSSSSTLELRIWKRSWFLGKIFSRVLISCFRVLRHAILWRATKATGPGVFVTYLFHYPFSFVSLLCCCFFGPNEISFCSEGGSPQQQQLLLLLLLPFLYFPFLSFPPSTTIRRKAHQEENQQSHQLLFPALFAGLPTGFVAGPSIDGARNRTRTRCWLLLFILLLLAICYLLFIFCCFVRFTFLIIVL